MKRSWRFALAVFSIGLLFLGGLSLAAQDARFRGTVKDENGNPIAGAKLNLNLLARNASFSFETNDKGKFYRRGIEGGEYHLSVEAGGYKTFQQQITINVGEEYTMDIILAGEVSNEKAKNMFLQGVELYKEGKFDQAIAAFEAVLQDKADFPEGYYNLGMAYLHSGESDKALAAMKKAVELKPDFLEAYFGLGQIYVGEGNYQEAIEIFNKAITVAPEAAEPYLNLGILYFNNKEDDPAEAVLLKAAALKPSFPQPYYQLGLLYLRNDNVAKARQNFERFLELAPEAPEATAVRSILEDLEKR
ncbi:MAG: tetratricopeptide repeat protein [Candidatus Aminicenantales bacterium]